MSSSQTPEGMIRIVKKSALPIYAIGAVWLLFLYFTPLYKLSHFLTAAVVSLVVYPVGNVIFKPKVTFEEAPQAVPHTGDANTDAFLQQGAVYLQTIDALSDKISNPSVKAKVDGLEKIIGQTLAYVEENPKCVMRLTKFTDYYLPTLQKLVTTYVDLEKQTVQGENIATTLASIDTALDTLQNAFRKQLDALYDNTALDISTDITVLENILEQQGLNNNGNQLN